MKIVHKQYLIRVKAWLVYEYLVNPVRIAEWSGSPAEMSEQENSEFSLWGGSIHGINRKITPGLIVQDWKEKGWESYSTVTFKLKSESDGTLLELIHENIPDNSVEDIDEGWDEYYLGPLIELLESK